MPGIESRFRGTLPIAAGAAGVLLIGVLDELTGPEISFSFFYLLPISVVAWYVGLVPALLLSALSAGIWLLADFASAHVYSNPLIPWWNMAMRGLFFLLFSVLLARLREAYERERLFSLRDFLTGIGNRRSFQRSLDLEVARARRYGHPLSLAYIDLDDFKAVNDALGHRGGDALLGAVARGLQDNVRSFDFIARLGGDEFAILMPGLEQSDALSLVNRVRERLGRNVAEGGWRTTLSVGLITCYTLPDSTEELLRQADELMYTAKRNGKNGLECRVLGPVAAPGPAAHSANSS